MSERTKEQLPAGRDAARRHDWQEAFELLSSSDAVDALQPDDLEALAQAAWWTGRLDPCISARERGRTRKARPYVPQSRSADT